MRGPLPIFVLAALLPPALPAQEVLDDSASPVQQVRAELDWRVPLWRAKTAPAQAFTSMEASVPAVDIRLDTSEHVGRRARVFMTVPLPVRGLRGSQGLRVSWRADGLFEDGTLVPGQRTLVYSGPIRDRVLRDRLHFTVEIEGEAFTGTEIRFEPEFRIEPQ